MGKHFQELTYRGQVRRLRRLAQAAVKEFGLIDARLKFIAHGENATFRVDATHSLLPLTVAGDFVANRYVLRVHRPGYQSAASLASELAWLTALRRETQLIVPEPVPAVTGEFSVAVTAHGMPERRHCTLLRWVKGRRCGRGPRPNHFQALGRLMADLHNHAANWDPPPGFTRRRWDWEGLFGDNAGFFRSGREVWALLPDPYAERFKAVAQRTRRVMDDLSATADACGLIHADLYVDHVLFRRGEPRPIDFDDCGFGYWVYDFAVPLAHWQGSQVWPAERDALLEGYASKRPLPDAQLAYLDLFMAARHVSEMLWAVDIAQVNPDFRDGLAGWLEWADRHVRRFLRGAG